MAPSDLTAGPTGPVILVRGLSKSFGDNHVLDGVDLSVNRAENVAVLGRSGSGKSVLIKVMVGLLTPDSGSVEVLGKDVHTLDRRALDALRTRVGFCFQAGALYDSMDVGTNLAFPLRMNQPELGDGAVRSRIARALEAVGLPGTVRQMPSELSGGQRKRIGIARTLILEPEIMLYDEPTAGLDPVTSAEINQLIVQVRESYHTSAIIITHDLTCARNTADRVAMLIDGRIHRTGTFAEVFQSGDPITEGFYAYNFTQPEAS
jgi:phospholipid/cholesterol/gamma-HCH transport system ATP-binding protein